MESSNCLLLIAYLSKKRHPGSEKTWMSLALFSRKKSFSSALAGLILDLVQASGQIIFGVQRGGHLFIGQARGIFAGADQGEICLMFALRCGGRLQGQLQTAHEQLAQGKTVHGCPGFGLAKKRFGNFDGCFQAL
jgi:hypothetical protein